MSQTTIPTTDRPIPTHPSEPYWQALAASVRATPEFSKIRFHPKAGQVEDGRQYFFDGSVTTYPWACDDLHWFFHSVQGLCEPQEMLPYLKLLEACPPNATIVELGAGWGHYSIIAARNLSAAQLYLIEANPRLIEVGRQNILLNGLQTQAQLIHAAAWETAGETVRFREAEWGSYLHTKGEYEVTTISVDHLLSEIISADEISILHLDVQGAENAVLRGSRKSLQQKSIAAVVVGTHSNEVHYECRAYLEDLDYQTHVSIDLDETASGDGILVAVRPGFGFPDRHS